jgi:hypothetical protein
LTNLFLKKHVCGDGVSKFLENWQEDSVVERQIDVRVRVHQPTGERGVGTGQLALATML